MGNTINPLIPHGLTLLQSWQETDGSFTSLSSSKPDDFSSAQVYKTIFSCAWILICLNNLSATTTVEDIQRNLATYLLNQKSKYWSWNYWDRTSSQATTLPYPDDLDDTFCSLEALCGFNSLLIDGSVLAQIVMLLTQSEVQEGGPYFTWLVDGAKDTFWRDSDLAVNANIATFLRRQNITLPNLMDFFEASIRDKKFVSPYYPSIFPVLFFLSRAYQGKNSQVLISFLLDQQSPAGNWSNPLNTALAILSLRNLGFEGHLPRAIQFLEGTMEKDGWPAYAFCFDPAQNKTPFYAGSRALTTAFCLSALVQEDTYERPRTITIPSFPTDIQTIVSHVTERFDSFTPSIRSEAHALVQSTLLRRSLTPIILLPLTMETAIQPQTQTIARNWLIKMGEAVAYGWLAYTIFDDFLDREGNPAHLPLATVCLRELIHILDDYLPLERNTRSLVKETIDAMEAANFEEAQEAWFVKHGDFIMLENELPHQLDLHSLAAKSLGLALPPLAVLLQLGYAPDSPEVTQTKQFFIHFLTARQLNDDAHDWEADFIRGHLNPVSTELLRHYNVRAKKRYSTSRLLPKLRQQFRETGLVETADIILREIAAARMILATHPLITHPEELNNLLLPLERAAHEAKKEHSTMTAFLHMYRKP